MQQLNYLLSLFTNVLGIMNSKNSTSELKGRDILVAQRTVHEVTAFRLMYRTVNAVPARVFHVYR